MSDDIATRIERAYQRATGSESPRGARTWFARTAHVSQRHVSRLVSGETPLQGPVLGLLETLERTPP